MLFDGQIAYLNLPLELPRIYPITDAELAGCSHLVQAERLIAAGARLIQIREKHASSEAFYLETIRVVAVARPVGIKIIVNDRVDIAVAAGADGVHLGQTDLPAAAAREILGPHAVIGISTHSVEQAREAASMPVDYIAVGPIFPTATKANPDPVLGIDGLRQIRMIAGGIPIVAIGGITAANLAEVLRSGADSAAMISAIVGAGDEIGARYAALEQIASAV